MVQEMAQGGRWWGNGVCEGCLKTAGVRWCRAGDGVGSGMGETVQGGRQRRDGMG